MKILYWLTLANAWWQVCWSTYLGQKFWRARYAAEAGSRFGVALFALQVVIVLLWLRAAVR
jgi:hypothetical protein